MALSWSTAGERRWEQMSRAGPSWRWGRNCQCVVTRVEGDGCRCCRYGVGVTAAASNPFHTSPVPALPPDTTPAAIRDALIDEERAEFEHAYQEAMLEAARTLDLTRVLDVLRNYHRIAWLTQRQGPAAHRRMLDKAAEILRTGRNPDAVSMETVRALIAKRCGQ